MGEAGDIAVVEEVASSAFALVSVEAILLLCLINIHEVGLIMLKKAWYNFFFFFNEFHFIIFLGFFFSFVLLVFQFLSVFIKIMIYLA